MGGASVPRLDPESLSAHVDRLYRAAWALCGSPHDAEDLVQETFARVLARPRVLRGDDQLAYLMRVLRNTFLSSRRTASRRPHVTASVDDLELAGTAATDQPERALEAQAVYGAIAGLPDDFRLALIAVDIVGLSYGEAGRVLGAPEATITSRLHRARRRVVAAVDAPGGQPPRSSAQTSGEREGTRPPRRLD
jgi:RNA polymerase sigma-70 factor (ECF subfamily)